MNDFAHKCKSPFLSLSLKENASLKAPWQGNSGSQSPRNCPSIIFYSTTLSLSTTYKYHSNLHQMSLSSASNRTVTWCKWRANLRQVTRQSDASYKVVQCDFSLLIHSCYHINTHEAAFPPLETGGVACWEWEVNNVKDCVECPLFTLSSLGNKRHCLLKMRSK